jgi:hypothetical protein
LERHFLVAHLEAPVLVPWVARLAGLGRASEAGQLDEPDAALDEPTREQA